MSENKLQIRARLLSAIINMQNNSHDRDFIKKTLDELHNIDDEDAVLDILLKELLKENSSMKDYTLTFLLKELVIQEKIEKAFYGTLANPKIKDAIKAKLVGFLRECGKHVNYEQYVSYFENPDEIIDADTVKLLENAKINPESQIDFLDFLAALPQEEKNMLVESLTEDYDGDNLANILIPIIMSNPYSEISQRAIKAIGESKSKLAYPVLKWLESNVEDLNVRSHVQKSMSLLKLSGIKEDVSAEYYEKILADSPVYKCFVNFPDGHGNLGLIFSRKNEYSLIQMFALVLNDIDGIIDCFGFNEISEGEFDRIVNKFYLNDNVVQIDEKLSKYLMYNAEKISRLKYADISYEYVAWSSITKDIDFEEIKLAEGHNQIKLNEFLLKQLYEKSFFDKWFFEVNDNESFNSLIEEIENKNISEISAINSVVENYKPLIFTQDYMKIFNHRLLFSAHIAGMNGDEIFSDIIYSLVDENNINTEIKNIFLTDILKKSVYQYFLSQKDKFLNKKNATSIFTRRANKELENIDIKYVDSVIKQIEMNWM